MPKKPIENLALDFRAALRVKVKSLADEAKIIRREESRSNSWHEWMSLKEHRRTVVRREARAAQLALGFLRGRRYSELEQTTRMDNAPDAGRVEKLIQKYVVPPGIPSYSREADRLRANARMDLHKWWST